MLATRLADYYLSSQKPNLEWLDEANWLMDRALKMTPQDSNDCEAMYFTLCIINFHKYKETNLEVDIDKSISYGRLAVNSLPEKDHRLPLRLTGFSESLALKFENEDFGRLDDLDEALVYSCKVLALTSPTDRHLDYKMDALCYMLQKHAEVTGIIDTLEEAIQTRRSRDYTVPNGVNNLMKLRDLLIAWIERTRKPEHLGIMIYIGRRLFQDPITLSQSAVLNGLTYHANNPYSNEPTGLYLLKNAIRHFLEILKNIGEGSPQKSISYLVDSTKLTNDKWRMMGDPVDGFFADDIEVWNTCINLEPGDHDSRNERKGPSPYIPDIEENKAKFAEGAAADAAEQGKTRSQEGASHSGSQSNAEASAFIEAAEKTLPRTPAQRIIQVIEQPNSR